MILYRIVKCLYADDLSGEGSRLFGGRWNSIGKRVTYLASSRSLAVLEVLVHLNPLIIPKDYCLVEIEIPDNCFKAIAADILPADWKDVSPPASLRQFGDDLIDRGEYLALQVPSSIIPEEHNYLVNPYHPLMKKVKVLRKQPFSFDQRLI